MNTGRFARLSLDPDSLAADLRTISSFTFDSAYREFVFGEWRSCMLWNSSGSVDETHISSTEGAARPTVYGRAAPYLAGLVEQVFRLDRLRFGRIAQLMPGTVLVPHCDFLELSENLLRIHVPLYTSRTCLNAEESVVFHMDAGEVWLLDANRIHSAASFWDQPRTHLILDFAATGDIDDLLRIDVDGARAIPIESVAFRPTIAPDEVEALMALSRVIDHQNYRDIFALLIRKSFCRDVSLSTVYNWLAAIGQGSGNQALVEELERQRRYFLVCREAAAGPA